MMENIILRLWTEEKGRTYQPIGRRLINKRLLAAETYSWAVPNESALEEITKYQPILEGGAGLGYWAKLLQDQDVDIIPSDPSPPVKGWTDVVLGDAYIFSREKHRTLFLCWVPEEDAKEVVESYSGNIVLWVGEPIRFTGFKSIKTVNIPQWDGYKDALFVFRRT